MEGRNRAENLLKKVFGVEVGLGSFRPTLSVYTFDTPEEVTAAGIKHVRTRFTPGTRLVAAMRTGVGSGLTFGKVSAGDGQDMPADETE